ncbi:hypothetical protein GF385_03550 [Candidatus Dependentiae bacterium]|nr:hypothetical protein [Candidatus Dependentiae bacterium]
MKSKFIFLLTILYITNLNIKAETIQEFLKENSTQNFDLLLGKGGTGEVWGSSTSNTAMKAGSDKSQCSKIKEEFNIQKKVYDTTKEYDKNLLNRIIILNPSKIIENKKGNICAMQILRLYPIKEEPNKKLLTQLKLGKKNLDLEEKLDGQITKGHSIGYEQTKKIVSEYPRNNKKITNIEQLFADIGKLLGILIFKAKLDGLDTEFCLVREDPKSKMYKIAFLDFGMCNDLSKLFDKKKYDKIMQKVIKAFTVENILPNPTNPEFKFFMEEFINIAKAEKLKDFAQEIIHNFIAEQFLKENIIKEYLMKKLKIRNKNSFQLKKLSLTLLNWVKKDLIEKTKEEKYNIKEGKLSAYLSKIVPNIIEKKAQEKKLTRFEKVLLKKLEKTIVSK